MREPRHTTGLFSDAQEGGVMAGFNGPSILFLNTYDTLDRKSVTIDVPNLDFGWRKVEMTFLPKQFDEFETLAKTIDKDTEIVGVAGRDMYGPFCDAMVKYGRTRNIKSFGAIVSKLTEIALREVQEAEHVEKEWKAD